MSRQHHAHSISSALLHPPLVCHMPAGASKAKTSSVQALDAAGVVAFLAARPKLAVRVGPSGSEASWTVKEVGDGNINFVFIVQV